MDTDQARHQAGGGPTPTPFFSTAHRVPAKLHNGDRLPAAGTPPPHAGSAQSPFRGGASDRGMYGINGETRHDPHDPCDPQVVTKKFCFGSETGGGLHQVLGSSKSPVSPTDPDHPDSDPASLPMLNGATHLLENPEPQPRPQHHSGVQVPDGSPADARGSYASNGYEPALNVNGHGGGFRADPHRGPPYPPSDLTTPVGLSPASGNGPEGGGDSDPRPGQGEREISLRTVTSDQHLQYGVHRHLPNDSPAPLPPPPQLNQGGEIEQNPEERRALAAPTQAGWIDLNAAAAVRPPPWRNLAGNQSAESPGGFQALCSSSFTPSPMRPLHSIASEPQRGGPGGPSDMSNVKEFCPPEYQAQSDQPYVAHQHPDTHTQNPRQFPTCHPAGGYTQPDMLSPTYGSQRAPDPGGAGSNPRSDSAPPPGGLPATPRPFFQRSQQHPGHPMPDSLGLQQLHGLAEGLQSRNTPAQTFPKTELRPSCMPGTQGDAQRLAALRAHLLQKQEGSAHPRDMDALRTDVRFIKREGGPGFEAPQTQHQGATVKQEPPFPACWQSQQKSFLSAMEQKLQRYPTPNAPERRSLLATSPNKVKLEMSGRVAVISTNLNGSAEDPRRPPSGTPKREPGLRGFLESPMKLLNTPIKNLLDTPSKTQYEIPSCHCVEQIVEKDEGPYYTHLGAAPNIKGIREIMETRSGLSGGAIRIEKVVYTGKEGKSTQGCPIAKWVIRRASVEEKLLVVVRERAGHSCSTSCVVVAMVIWEGIQPSLADRLYTELGETLTRNGVLTNRRCALNEERTCTCQGVDADASGASFSFGCSWSMYYNGCKFARSKVPRKFKLLGDDCKEEERLERNLQELATLIGPTYKQMAPEAYSNQVEYEYRAPDCRLGLKEGRPFSGVTACLDFCAHAHRDLHNMPGGSTVVCTLTREDNRQVGEVPEDEQLHVLPLYKPSSTDEFGSAEAQMQKARSGAIQVLQAFRRRVRMLPEPAKSCRQRKLEGKRAASRSHLSANSSKMENAQAKLQRQSSGCSAAQNPTVAGPEPGQHGALPPVAPNQPQHQQSKPGAPLHLPSPSPPAGYPPTYPSTPGPFPRLHGSPGPYNSHLQVVNPYMNGPDPPSPYPGALPPNNLYPGYQCTEGAPAENYHPYYSGPNSMSVYGQQRPPMYPDQAFGISYPPGYGEQGPPVNGYCSTNMHRVGHYPGYGPNSGPNAQFMGAVPRTSSAHPGLDYAAANKCAQLGRYPSPYLVQNPQMQFSQKPDPLSMGSSGYPVMEGMMPGQPPGMSLPNGTMLPTVVKQEPGAVTPTPEPEEEDVWSDNEHNFLDPDIGGVAVAPSHGSILIECAKRELHATTPLRRPDRTHPTRISLVFYQHKNLNEAKHGLTLWEAKMAEKAREKEEDAEKNGADGTPSKGGKRVKREPPEPTDTSNPPYKRFIQMLAERSQSCTTNTYVSSAPYAFTKVTGPYSHFS